MQLQEVVLHEIEFLANVLTIANAEITAYLTEKINEISEVQKSSLENYSGIFELEKRKLEERKRNFEKIKILV